jgi:coniferyl-aldehyde dehydrogenase
MTDASTEAARLLDLQRAALRREGAPNGSERDDRLMALSRMLKARNNAFAEAISADFGNRSRTETSLLETSVVLASIRYARRNLRWWMEPQRSEVDFTFWPGSAWVRREPLGIIGVISPWNYPLQLCLSPLVDILAAGNRAVIKPSEHTPKFSALLKTALAEIFNEDVVGVVLGGPDVAEAFTKLSFDHIVFTGSTSVGRRVATATAPSLVPTTLELGGKSPAIICPSASMKKAVKTIAYGKFVNAGQTCIAPDYVLIPRGRAIEFTEAIMAEVRRAYPSLDGDYATMINERAFDRMTAALAEAETGGARVMRHPSPSDRGRRLMPPSIVLDPPQDCMLMREEVFGPILSVVGYDTIEDALDWISRHPQPLALYIFAEDRREQADILDRTQSGGVTINGTLLHIAQEGLPFGGIGASGMGHYHGKAGFDRFTHARAVFRTGWFNSASWLAPPYGETARRLLRFLMR